MDSQERQTMKKFRIRSASTPSSPPVTDVTVTEEELSKRARATCLRAIQDRLPRFNALPPELQLTVMRGIVHIAAPRLKSRLFLDYKSKHWRFLQNAVTSKGYGINKRDLFDALLSHIDYISQTQFVKYDPDPPAPAPKFRVRMPNKGGITKTSPSSQKKSVRRKEA